MDNIDSLKEREFGRNAQYKMEGVIHMKTGFQHKMKRGLSLLLTLAMLAGVPGLTGLAAGAGAGSRSSTPELKLWYNKPTSQSSLRGATGSGVPTTDDDRWQKNTLPIGNGDLGANVYGEIGTERLTLNEKTLWNGGPSESRQNYIGGNLENKGRNGEQLKTVQQYFLAGNTTAAVNAAGQLIGEDNGNYGYYAPWGELRIATSGLTDTSTVTGYERWLTLDDALAGVRFTSGGTTYTREYLMSNPDNVLAVKLTASRNATFTITLPGKMNGSVTTATAVGNDTLKLCGHLTDNQEKYASFLKAVPGGGTTVAASGSSLTVTGTEVTLFFSAATDYKAIYPTYRNGETDVELAARVKAVADAAAGKGYDAVKADHLSDYHSLYNRVSVDVGQTSTTKPTDELIVAYKNGTATAGEERLLEMMLFQYGRYLTIAASRENSILPTNLQGVWNNRNNPPWMSDYHTNVNLQMNYWPTYSTNLAECADSLIRFTESLREPGRVTARVYAGIESTVENPENGFMAHTQTTPYGYTTPGWSFDWGWSPAAIAWLIQNCWEYYEYTGDLNYMRNNIYPIMREYCRFYDQFLIDTTTGKTADKITSADTNVVLASVPAYSPETGPRTMGNTYEHSIIWQLYEDTMTAAKLLGVDSDRIGDENTVGTWLYNQSHLQGPIEIGASGQIKEWFHEVEFNKDADGNTLGQGYDHRHLSHMLGIYPGDLIQTNPEWIEAARVSMNNRNDVNTGWSMTHRANVWARLRDGNHAHKVLGLMIKNDKFYNNLWDTHAPFQIDGNFGYTAAVSEMLLQSNMGFIDLLPALPDAWANGSYSGLMARGNFELSTAWSDSSLTGVTILSKNGGQCAVRYPGISRAVVKDAADNLIEFEVLEDDKISFPSAKGATYTITEIPTQDVSVVEDAAAYRTADDSAELFWTVKDGESYQVYRQIAGGELLPVGEPVTEGHFLDEAAYMALGEIMYFISVDGKEPSDAIPMVDMRNQMFDDKDSRIVYKGSGWNTWNDSACYEGGIHFIESINTTTPETLEFTFYGTGIEVYGCPNTSWGTMTAAMDGIGSDTVSFRDTRAHTQKIFTKDGLTRGIHTIKLTGVSGKIEFDAFKVLDTGGAEAPDTITVTAAGGVNRLTATGNTLQMISSEENVVWSVTGTANAATISEKGLLTAGDVSGTVKAVATSALDATVKDEYEVTISIPGSTTYVPSTVGTSSISLNSAQITYASPGSAWYTWNEGGTYSPHKAEVDVVGASFTYQFEVPAGMVGTVGVYAQTLNQNAGIISFTLDGGTASEVSLLSTSPQKQLKIKDYTELAAGSHTLVGTATTNPASNNAKKINLDYIKLVLMPAVVVDRSELLALINECAALEEDAYTTGSWSAFQTALTNAGTTVNKETVTDDEISTQVTALTAAKNALVPKDLTAPANLNVALTEGTAVTLKWDSVIGATGYKVSAGGEIYETTATTYRVTGLDSGAEYSFAVKAVNNGGESPASGAVTATTLDTVAPAQPTNLAWNESTNTLTWDASTDNVGVTGYEVLVNGVQQGEAEAATSKSLTLSGTQNAVAVIAVDAAGNESIPAKLVVAPTYAATAANATIEGGKTRFKAGEAVTVTATVPKGSILTGWEVTGVTLSDADNAAETVTFSMPAGNVSLTANVEEKNWNVTAELTNLYSDLPTGKTVSHGDELTVRLTAMSPYKLPTSVQVVMGGQQLQAPWVTYDATTGTITIREVTGDVVITAENAPQIPTGTTFTAADPFQLPTNEGDSTKLEAEYMELARGSGSSLAAVYGPNFGNKQLKGFVTGDEIKLYYNAEYPGTYTLTLRYSSAQTADTPHKLNWSGEKVEAQTNSVESTLEDGTAIYSTTELEFTVTKEGAGMVAFTTAAPGGPDIDSMIFTLNKIDTTPVEEITLDETEVILYLSGADGEDTAQLTATVTPDEANNKELRWSSSDVTVAYVTQDGVVGARSNGTAVITATAMDGSNKTATAEVTVKTRISGSVSISGEAKYDQQLVASINQISNQNAQDTLTYQWNRDGEPIEGATDRHYTVVEADIGCELTVTAFANDPYVGAEDGATSDPVTATLADGPDVNDTLDAEDFTDTENGKIIGLDPEMVYEYKLVSGGEGAWTEIPADSTEFEVPAPGSYHVRVAATDTANAGVPSSTLTILAAGVTGNAISIGTFTGGVVRADVNKANEGDTVTLTVLPKTGYQLVDGSLMVNDGAVVVENDGTFAMPDGEATVTAEFELKTYILTHSLTNIGCNQEEHGHEVTHGDKPIITLEPEEGYDLPHVITVTVTETGAPFIDYTYDEGQIIFDSGITAGLTITGAGIKKSLPVIYALYGLTSLDGARSVEYQAGLSFTITPKTSYTLPDEISMTMGGEEFTDFTYTVAGDVATVAIAAGKITGELAITAEGTSELPSLALVEITGTAMVGRTLRAVATPSNVFPDYRWLRVDSEGNEFPIYGATNRTYVITTEDEGYAIRVAATGAGVKFGNTIYSEPTAVVENANVVATTGVALNKTAATITVGGNALQLTATVEPANASNKAVTWESSDENVAFVASNGAVFGRGLGTATITVTTVNGSKTATCTVTVVAVSLPASVSVSEGRTATIKVTIPEDLSNKTLTWTSSDETVATVDENGVVTGVKAGTATITVTTGDGYTATCSVKVSTHSSSSARTESTKTETREDGSKVTTVTDNITGVVTETVQQPDGTKSETVTTKDGTTITVTDPEGEVIAEVKLPATIAAPEKRFVDVPENHWAAESIDAVAGLGLVEGIGGNRYDTVSFMTRGSLATVLFRLSNGKNTSESIFKDVEKDEWYVDGVMWAAKCGVVRGVGAELFKPNDFITREQLAVMLSRYAKLVGLDTKADTKVLEKFSDSADTGDWAENGVAWCVEKGILRGKSGMILDPSANVSRAEVAVMFQRFIDLMK